MSNKPFTRRDFLKLIGAITAAPLAARLIPQVPQPQNLPNVLILVFDTLSARHMSLYGYPRETTPNLKRFAEVSTVYHNHWAAGNFTTPGTASLLTGVYPWEHRAMQLFGQTQPAFATQNLFQALPFAPQSQTMYVQNHLGYVLLKQFAPYANLLRTDKLGLSAGLFSEILFERDFSIAIDAENIAFGRDFSAAGLLFGNAIRNGFDTFNKVQAHSPWATQFPYGPPEFTQGMSFLLEQAIDWTIEQVNTPAPHLHYIHLWPPHEPYKPRAEFLTRFPEALARPIKPLSVEASVSETDLATFRRQYDQYLAYADAEFGRLFNALQASGRLEDTLIIFTSDHGQLFERGIHGHITSTLYEGLLHIPLMIHAPAQKTRGDVYVPTSAVDVLPTVATLLGVEPPAWVEGSPLPMGGEGAGLRAISPLLMGEGLGVRAISPLPVGEGLGVRAIFAIEAKESSKWGKLPKATFAMRIGDYKLIYYRGYPQLPEGWELYNLKNDPEELENRFDSDPIAKDLQTYLRDTLMKKELFTE